MWICRSSGCLTTMFGQEGHKLLAGVASGGLAMNLAGLSVERGVERESAVADVLETVPLRPAGRQGQNRIFAVQRLDSRFLVHAKHHGMLRGIEIEPDHIGGLLLELGVVGRHVALHPVWLDPVLLPGPSHHHVVDAELLGQAPRTPVRRPVARLLARPVQDPRPPPWVSAPSRAVPRAGRRARPARSATNRFFHLLMNGSEQSTRPAISR